MRWPVQKSTSARHSADAPHSQMRLGLGCMQPAAAPPHQPSPFTCSSIHSTDTMAATYKPSEAIAHLRPSFLLPRIPPCATRRAQLARAAFSTSRPAHATHSSPTPTPPTPPPRKSITLTGDTGRVRWSELSPGEKAVRTTQQSANLVVVLVGIVATVRSLHPHMPCKLY